MAPPKPTKAKQQANFVPVKSMKSYNNMRSTCFAGECLISMADGSLKQVKDLVKGDLVSTPSGSASIICLLKTL